jgi:hypothetical protein
MKQLLDKAKEYQRNYKIIGRAHYIAWEEAARKNNWLGIPVVIATTTVGTAIFGTIQDNPVIGVKIFAGLLSLFAGILSSLQTVLKYSELAEKHKTAGARYTSARRRLDIFILKYENQSRPNKEQALRELEEIANLLGELAEESPSIPDKVYDKAEKEFLMAAEMSLKK